MSRSGIHPSVPGPIDWDHLSRMTAGDATLAAEVLGLFREQATGLKGELLNPSAGLPAPVHKLKGSAQGIGAWQVAEAAERLEHVLQQRGDPASARDALIATLAAACMAIDAHVRSA